MEVGVSPVLQVRTRHRPSFRGWRSNWETCQPFSPDLCCQFVFCEFRMCQAQGKRGGLIVRVGCSSVSRLCAKEPQLVIGGAGESQAFPLRRQP
jgi:hypothetical protein